MAITKEQMFAITYLLVFALMMAAIYWLAGLFPPKVKACLILALVVLSVSFPFWHHLYPSYKEFMVLCERPDRHVLLKTVEVDYAYSGTGSFGAYGQLEGRGYKGFEVKQNRLGYVRYTKNENWASSACQRDCANPSLFVWEKTCEVNCLTKTTIPAPEFEHTFAYKTRELLKGRLVEQRSAVLAPSGEELSVTLNYLYFPYGTGWAKILGLASGDPPTQSCRVNQRVDMQEFMRPRAAL